MKVLGNMNDLVTLKPNINKSQRNHYSPRLGGMKRFTYLYDRAMKKPERMFKLELKGESEIFAPTLSGLVEHKNRLVEFKGSNMTTEEKLKKQDQDKIVLFNRSLK